METMHNYLINKISYFVIGLALALMAITAYWLIFPYKTLVINQKPIPIFEQEVRSGGAVVLIFDSCNFEKKPAKVESQLVGSSIQIDLPTYETTLPKGCNVRNAPILIPKITNFGTYRIHYKITFQLNPLKKDIVEFDTADFEIKK